MEAEGKKHCLKCLLREMDKDAYFQNLHDYIAGELYEDRLAVCKQCDMLQEGMCRACGCFVELRAVIRVNGCPYDKW